MATHGAVYAHAPDLFDGLRAQRRPLDHCELPVGDHWTVPGTGRSTRVTRPHRRTQVVIQVGTPCLSKDITNKHIYHIPFYSINICHILINQWSHLGKPLDTPLNNKTLFNIDWNWPILIHAIVQHWLKVLIYHKIYQWCFPSTLSADVDLSKLHRHDASNAQPEVFVGALPKADGDSHTMSSCDLFGVKPPPANDRSILTNMNKPPPV